MYLQNPGQPYKQFQWDTNTFFQAPHNRHHSPLVAYSLGAEQVYAPPTDRGTHIWKAYMNGDDLMIEREDNPHPIKITTKQGITSIGLSFDQNMNPFLLYVANKRPFYYYFNAATSNYEEVPLPVGWKHPCICMDYTQQHRTAMSDIILGFVQGADLCFAIQRERFLQKHVIETNPKKSILYKIARLSNTRFAYQWR